MKAKSILSVPIKNDGSAFAIKFLDDSGNQITIEFPGSEVHKLARYVQAISPSAPQEPMPPAGTEKAFPLTKCEIGQGFPDGIFVMFQSAVFGRMSFALDAETALRISNDLRSCAESFLKDQSNPRSYS